MKTNCFPFIDIFELLHFQVLHLIKGGLQLGHLYNPFNGNNDSDWGHSLVRRQMLQIRIALSNAFRVFYE